MGRFFWPVAILICLAAHLLLHDAVWNNRAEVRQATPAGYTLPSKFSRILALGNKGLLADFLFLKTITFLGERIGEDRVPSTEDWRFIVQSLEVVTDLDPYFLDPYIFAQGVLAWDAQMPEEAIRFLEKGFASRTQEWRLVFYAGFDAFYFLGDYVRAAELITQASKVEGSYSFLPDLASRLYYYGGKSRTATLFLKDMLATTQDPSARARMARRLEALEKAATLEDLMEKYQKELGRPVTVLSQLTDAGYLSNLPVEPYGGQWIIAKNGRVFSTSKFTDTLLQ